MKQWDYTEITLVREKKTREQYWTDHRNWKMHPIKRLDDLSEVGWELAGTYTTETETESRVSFLLKRRVLL
jgi:hypothetical protein